MTDTNVIRTLTSLKKSLEKKKVHYTQMFSWDRDAYEGFNIGLEAAIVVIDRRIKRLKSKRS